MSAIRSIPICNSEILKSLNNFLWFYENPIFVDNVRTPCPEEKNNGEKWVSDKHRDEIMAMRTQHEGYPDAIVSYAIQPNRTIFKTNNFQARKEIIERFTKYNTELCNVLMTRNNALGVLYPPGGFISWHNNANAPGYNIIFTWSEKGDGYFKYVDPDTGQEVVLQDTVGWSCKAGYFGYYDELPVEKLCYHSAYTNCWRMTVSYMYTAKELAGNVREDILEEIMSEV